MTDPILNKFVYIYAAKNAANVMLRIIYRVEPFIFHGYDIMLIYFTAHFVVSKSTYLFIIVLHSPFLLSFSFPFLGTTCSLQSRLISFVWIYLAINLSESMLSSAFHGFFNIIILMLHIMRRCPQSCTEVIRFFRLFFIKI